MEPGAAETNSPGPIVGDQSLGINCRESIVRDQLLRPRVNVGVGLNGLNLFSINIFYKKICPMAMIFFLTNPKTVHL